ncbi:hypothetical protein HPB51_012501 [Rhipicephalus microplus]|uniref:DIX domain-containing protein n=1 Tax=Rhipicephalus microplus TaxID=6941 RepID=A0A9J6DGM7_RHIMP|nr:hypothetical protein HPB51_012501 [Rhipicephalus microplus]
MEAIGTALPAPYGLSLHLPWSRLPGLVGGAGRQAAPGGEIITPHRFRSFISKKGNHRFFRRSCQEFGTDVVSEEMPDDNEVLSLGGQDPRHAHFGDNNSSNYQLRFPTEKAWQNSADKAPHSPLNSQEFRVDPRKHCIWLRPGRRDGSWIRVAAQPSSRRNDCSIPPLPPVVMGVSLDRRHQQVVLVTCIRTDEKGSTGETAQNSKSKEFDQS